MSRPPEYPAIESAPHARSKNTRAASGALSPRGGAGGEVAGPAEAGQAARGFESAGPRPFSVVRGSENILAFRDALSGLAGRCGDLEAVAHLPYLLSACRLGPKVPYLMVRRDNEGELESAVLLNEYILWGVPTGIFVPADLAGQQNVFAAETMRSRVAEEAAVFLMRGRGLVVQVSVKDGVFSALKGRGPGRFLAASQSRSVIQTLRLAATFDATMALLGAHTRRNLRQYRRRAERELRATFETRVDLSEGEFLALNEHTLYPVPLKAARCRYRWAHENGGSFLVGLRAGDGAWLSLVGGRRHGGSTTIDWQMNANALPAFSLGTAMRAFLLEYEVALGTRRLTFDGGTPHSMHRSFVPETVSDLLLTRWFLPLALLRRLIPPRLPAGEVLRKMLLSETLVWRG